MSRYGTARGGMQTSSLSNDKYTCPICSNNFSVGRPRGGFYAHFTRKSILLCNDQYKRKRIKREVWHCLVEDDKKKWNGLVVDDKDANEVLMDMIR